MESGRFGCERCFGADAESAWQASRQQPVRSLVDETHFGVRVLACACGQRFASVFTERIDWNGGNDDQTWLVLPIDAAEFQQLATCSEGDLKRLLTGFGHERRFLLRTYPTAGPLTAMWRDRGFAIGPHD